MRNFRESPTGFFPKYDGEVGIQCTATCGVYRCVLDMNHTAEHFTYGINKSYIFDNNEDD